MAAARLSITLIFLSYVCASCEPHDNDDLSLLQFGGMTVQSLIENSSPMKAVNQFQHASEKFEAALNLVFKDFLRETGEVFVNVTDMRHGLMNVAIVTGFDHLGHAANHSMGPYLQKELDLLESYMTKAQKSSEALRGTLTMAGQKGLADNLGHLTDAAILKLRPIHTGIKKGIHAMSLVQKEKWLKKDAYVGRAESTKEGVSLIQKYRKDVQTAFVKVEQAQGDFFGEVAKAAANWQPGSDNGPAAVRAVEGTLSAALQYDKKALDELLESWEVSLQKADRMFEKSA